MITQFSSNNIQEKVRQCRAGGNAQFIYIYFILVKKISLIRAHWWSQKVLQQGTECITQGQSDLNDDKNETE